MLGILKEAGSMAYDIDTAKALVIQAGNDMIKKGLIARTWGNISARISPTHFVITPSGRAYDTLTPEDLVVVRIEDASFEGDRRPSSEVHLHAGVYALRSDASFLIHTHQSYASAIGVLGEDLRPQQMEPSSASSEERQVLGDCVPCAAYGLSSTKKLARMVADAVRRHEGCKAVLLRYHGVLSIGSDQEEAYRIADALEAVCERRYQAVCGDLIPKEAGKCQMHDLYDRYVIHTRTPFVMAMSRRGETLRPYIDDVAQIAGTRIYCLQAAPSMKALRRALHGRDAVLLRDDGALCCGSSRDEAEALCLVLEKGCQAALLGTLCGREPVDPISAAKERWFYVKKYAARKNAR